jgi:hypothetical protein
VGLAQQKATSHRSGDEGATGWVVVLSAGEVRDREADRRRADERRDVKSSYDLEVDPDNHDRLCTRHDDAAVQRDERPTRGFAPREQDRHAHGREQALLS